MARLSNNRNSARLVKVTCTDTDKIVDAELILSEKSKIIVQMPTGDRITMFPHPTKPNLYVGNVGKLELVCSPGG
jgi:hypothetical protein